jgi:hypothetical protein
MTSNPRHNKPKQGKPEPVSEEGRTDPHDRDSKKDDVIDDGSEPRSRRSVGRSEYESYYRDF